MNNELISVIIPIYNVEKYLEKCIESIINQTYKNLEIILVDDGSKDKSDEICDEYAKKDNRIKVIHKENSGVSSARNVGIENSKGEYISFVDSDDWLEKDFIEKLHNIIKENNSDLAQSGYYRVVGENKEKINSTENIENIDKNEFLIRVLSPQTGFGLCHMKLIKKKIIGDIRFNENLKAGEDALFNEMISQNIKKATFYGYPLYNYRINENSAVKRFDKNYPNKYKISMEETKKYLLKNYSDNKKIMQCYYNFVAFHILLILVNYCYHPDLQKNAKERKNLVKEILAEPIFKEAIKKSNYENISATRKITLFAVKHRLYLVIKLICEYRQKMNRR